jgi:8-oxo-dGTP pyrophosphatase MutT (NUDIX family)
MNVPPTGVLRKRIWERFANAGPHTHIAGPRLAGLPPEYADRLRHLIPGMQQAAAVLIPIVDHGERLTVLLTQRAADLRHHAGQISFPGGRIEPDDAGALEAALRETQEEIGLSREHLQIVGYLPDHFVVSGFRVTPIIAFVRPGFTLRLDTTEVTDVFEVPLEHLLDAANHKARRRTFGASEFDVYDIPWTDKNIWGATAGMLMTLYRSLLD